MINLSEQQRRIVEYPIGSSIQVLASAGSGKTRVLTERIRFILETTKKEGVIALTFTNKAADEMLIRLEGIDDIEERCWIKTVHSVAQRVVEQYGHTIGLPSDLQIFEREQDRKAIFLQSLRDLEVDVDEFLGLLDGDFNNRRETKIRNCLEKFALFKRELLDENDINLRFGSDGEWARLYSSYQQSLIDSGGIDFDDILVYAHRILLEQSWCGEIYRAKYKHICVDEAQDLNRAQYEFIRALCGDEIRNVLMVGDPNQMIYGFNGSSHSFLCERFVSDFNPFKIELKENFRSSKTIICLANRLRPGSQNPSGIILEGKCEIKMCEDEVSEASWICDKISSLINEEKNEEIEGNITLNKMVIIARNRFYFRSISEQLSIKNIPFCIKKTERGQEPTSLFGKVLDLSIRLRVNTKNWVDGQKLYKILNLPIPVEWKEHSVFDDLVSGLRSNGVSNYSNLLANLLRSLQELELEGPNLLKLQRRFHREISAMNQSSEDEIAELERASQELDELFSSWTIFRRKGLGESLISFRNAAALGQLSEDIEPQGVTLSTVHTMKGLEKDIVFLVGMCEGVFPDYRAKSQKKIEEERNNAFVAITRSRRWVYITSPQYRKMPWGDIKYQQVSRFVTEMSK